MKTFDELKNKKEFYFKDFDFKIFCENTLYLCEQFGESPIKKSMDMNDILYSLWFNFDGIIHLINNFFIRSKFIGNINFYEMNCILASMISSGYYPKTFYVIGIRTEFVFTEVEFFEYFNNNRIESISFYPLFEID